MTIRSLAALSVLLLSCGQRAAPTLDGASTDGPRADAHAGDLGAFCSGLARASINGSTLMVEQVTGKDYISAAHSEGAQVEMIAAASTGERWGITAQVMSGLGKTITDRPLPRSFEIGPPDGIDGSFYFLKPAGCSSSSSPCESDLLSTEYHKLWGWATLKGTDYSSPLQLELCLSGSDNGGVHIGKVNTVQIYAPSVTIPRWTLW